MPVRRLVLAGAVLVVALAVLWGRRARDVPSQSPPAAAQAVKPAFSRSVAGAIVGQVVDPDGRGVEGAIVTAWRQRSPGVVTRALAPVAKTVKTSRGGAFRIELASGLYALAASAPGFTDGLRGQLEVGAGGFLDGIKLRLWRGGFTLSGRVLDAGGGTIPGAHLLASGYDLTPDGTHEARQFQCDADGEGRYRLPLPAGRHKLLVEADGYASALRSIDLFVSRVEDIALDPAARIAGRAISADDRQPVAGARVTVSRADRPRDTSIEPAITDERGVFRFGSLPAGSFKVKARKDELVGALGPIVLAETGGAEDLELAMSPGLTLEGKVTSLAGQPVPNASVRLSDPDARRLGPGLGPFVDDDGHYVIDGIVAGDYDLAVTANGFASIDETVSITGPMRRNFVLRPGAVVTGIVLTAAGEPAVRAQVEATVGTSGRVENFITTLTDGQGRFAFADLAARPVSLAAAWKGEAGKTGPEALEVGAHRELTLRLGPGAEIAGTAFWEDGSVAALVTVSAHRRNGILRASALAAADGTFVLTGIVAGEVSLSAAPGRDPSSLRLAAPVIVKVGPGEHLAGIKLVARR
jgi:hypothetical protein